MINTKDLIILNSNIFVIITLQNWTQDTFKPLMITLAQNGFTLGESPLYLAMKGTTTNVQVDYYNRRITIQITNNNTAPNENLEEIFSILSQIGYPSKESIARIDITGNISIKIADKSASSLVSNIVNYHFINQIGNIFERNMLPVGIRISTSELLTGDISKSPFVILLEPLLTDPRDSKLLVNIIYTSDNEQYTVLFLKDLYDRLKKIIIEFENE